MQRVTVARFAFRVRTRGGLLLDVEIPGRDRAQAEERLRQIYRDCDVFARVEAGDSASDLPAADRLAVA
jgi:hypothetical protein